VESLVLAQELGYKDGIALSVAGMGGVAGFHGLPERAGRLMGAASALAQVNAASEAVTRIELNLLTAAAKAHLDATTFEAGWTFGQAMTQAAAIAYALEEPAATA
jgi:hypothetical protein